ncbi:MAG: AAA family ATPase, partial [Gammaproteobacteria bacterium]
MFLRSIELQATALPDVYPFTVPAIETLGSLEFTSPVTFFVGENGCGKSSLLEA